MDQRPEPGLQPHEPPSAELARAYLQESMRVEQRREEHIDRRAAARLLLIEGAAFGVYLITLMLCFPPAADLNIAVLIAPFLIWTQLVATLREEYGYQRRGREQRLRSAVVLILLVMVVGALGTLFLGVEVPLAARLLPGVLAFLLYGTLAWDERRRATAGALVRERTPFTRTVRVTTIAIGIGLGAMVACVASPALVAAIVMMLVLLALTAWLLSSAVAGGTAVATAWGAFHWTCFAVSGLLVVALLMLAQFTTLPLEAAGYVAGSAIALGFVVGALREPRVG